MGMRPHAGVGTGVAHRTLSIAPMTVSVSFHEAVRWDGWILYSHESTPIGAGMSDVRGKVHTEGGALLTSFTHDAMIRPLRGGFGDLGGLEAVIVVGSRPIRAHPAGSGLMASGSGPWTPVNDRTAQ